MSKSELKRLAVQNPLSVLEGYATGDEYQRAVEWAVDEIESLRQQLAEASIKIAEIQSKELELLEAPEFCSGTSYIDDAHRIADEVLSKYK